MKLAFPEKKIKLLIDVEDKEKFNYEIKNNDISFIFPHQIRNIKEKFYNLVIGIDCFHEMDKSTLKFYFNSISNLTDKFYFSIWKKTKNWHSGNLIKKTEKLDYEKGDYPIPHNWTVQYKSELKFPSTQLGIGYLTKN